MVNPGSEQCRKVLTDKPVYYKLGRGPALQMGLPSLGRVRITTGKPPRNPTTRRQMSGVNNRGRNLASFS